MVLLRVLWIATKQAGGGTARTSWPDQTLDSTRDAPEAPDLQLRAFRAAVENNPLRGEPLAGIDGSLEGWLTISDRVW